MPICQTYKSFDLAVGVTAVHEWLVKKIKCGGPGSDATEPDHKLKSPNAI